MATRNRKLLKAGGHKTGAQESDNTFLKCRFVLRQKKYGYPLNPAISIARHVLNACVLLHIID